MPVLPEGGKAVYAVTLKNVSSMQENVTSMGVQALFLARSAVQGQEGCSHRTLFYRLETRTDV